MSLFDQQEEIVEVLKNVSRSALVYEGQLHDGTEWVVDIGDGTAPVLGIEFGGTTDIPNSQKGIIGAAHNGQEAIFSVIAVGTSKYDCRAIMQNVRDDMVGFTPTNASEIKPALYASMGAINDITSPTRYADIQTFTFISNSDKSC